MAIEIQKTHYERKEAETSIIAIQNTQQEKLTFMAIQNTQEEWGRSLCSVRPIPTLNYGKASYLTLQIGLIYGAASRYQYIVHSYEYKSSFLRV